MKTAEVRLSVCAAAVASLWCGRLLESAPHPSRALPLNRFPVSRQTRADARGFYAMPTAVEDDYFDGTSLISRVKRHLELARACGFARPSEA